MPTSPRGDGCLADGSVEFLLERVRVQCATFAIEGSCFLTLKFVIQHLPYEPPHCQATATPTLSWSRAM